MKRTLITALAAAFCVTPAFAGDLEAHCVAVTSENGDDSSGCGCLAETADAAVTEELLAATPEDDIESFSEAAQAALAACWPEADAA